MPVYPGKAEIGLFYRVAGKNRWSLKKLKKSQHLVDNCLILGPPGTRLGLPGSSKTAYNKKSTHQQNSTSLRDMAELTFDCIDEKTTKKPFLVGFGPISRPYSG